MAVSVSDRNPTLPPTASEPGELIAPAKDILDEAALCAALDAATAGLTDAAALRAAATQCLQTAQETGRAVIAAGIEAQPMTARRITRAYTHLTDGLVRAVLHVAQAHIAPGGGPARDQMAVMAVGGYGRGEMAPHSDVDLLFVTTREITPQMEKVI